MKPKTLPIRFDEELYAWLKDYAERKHSKMAAVITRLLVSEKEKDELNRIEHDAMLRRSQPVSSRKK